MKLAPAVNGLIRVVKGTSSETLAATIVSQLFLVVSGIVAARALGVDGRGTLAFLWLVPAVLVLLGGIGIAPATTYFVARESDHARKIVGMSVRILALSAFVMVLGYGATLMIFDIAGHDYTAAEAVLSVALIPVLLAQNLGTASLLGQQRYRSFNLTRIFPPFLYMVLATVLWAVGEATLLSLLGVMAGSWVSGSLITWLVLGRDLPDSGAEPETTRKDILGFGFRGVIGSVSPIDDVRLDQFMVGLMLDARALGLYVTAVAFCNLPRFVAFSIGAVAYPKVAAAAGRVRWVIASRYVRIGIPLVVGSVVAIMLALPFLLPFFFGDEFSDAVPIGRVLLLAAAFLATNRLLSEIARGLGHPGFGSIAETVNGVVFLLVLLAISGSLTASGVAWAVVAGAVSSTVVLTSLILRSRRMEDVA